jgi:hypothetical protein
MSTYRFSEAARPSILGHSQFFEQVFDTTIFHDIIALKAISRIGPSKPKCSGGDCEILQQV